MSLVLQSCPMPPPVETYTIQYILDGGTNGNNPTTYSSDDELITLVDPTRTGYDFAGWFSDAGLTQASTTIPTGSTGNKIFYAAWTITPYMITYILDGGTNHAGNPNSFSIEDDLITLEDPTKTGYDFSGWYLDAGFTTASSSIPSGTTEDQVFYARWTITTNTITYHLDDGTNSGSNPGSYTITDELIILQDPTRSGYFFVGWYSDAGFTTEADSIPAGSTGEKAFYARWMGLAKITASDGASIDYFGMAVDIDGENTVIGAYGDDDNGSVSGSAYIFYRDNNGDWDTGTKIIASDGTASDAFGMTVAIDGDTVIVGAPWDDAGGSTAGSAYIFLQDEQGLWDTGTRLIPDDIADNDQFGTSVAISGDTAAVGSPYDDDKGSSSGSIYVYYRDINDDWTLGTKISAADGTTDDRFGHAVAIDGDYIIAGSYMDDDATNGTDSGSAYIFHRSTGNIWDTGTRLAASDGEPHDYFGKAVAISGDTVIVGSPHDDDLGSASGSAYIFIRDTNDNWDTGEKLTAAGGVTDDRFGDSVSISGDLVVIGSDSDDDHGLSSGSAYLFSRDTQGDWDTGKKLTAPDGAASDYFGASVSIENQTIVSGAFFDDDNGQDSGSAYIYKIP